jgi:hypothetical protein
MRAEVQKYGFCDRRIMRYRRRKEQGVEGMFSTSQMEESQEHTIRRLYECFVFVDQLSELVKPQSESCYHHQYQEIGFILHL